MLSTIGLNRANCRRAVITPVACMCPFPPLSKKPADEARRQAVLQRVMDYNTQLAQECALHAHCKFDNNAVFNRKFSLSDLGTVDYFHPSVQGQAALAHRTWTAGFGW